MRKFIWKLLEHMRIFEVFKRETLTKTTEIMTTSEKINIETARLIGPNVVSVSGNDIARLYRITVANLESAEKVSRIWTRAGASASTKEVGEKIMVTVCF